MIWFFHTHEARAGSCDHYDELLQCITDIENLKFLGDYFEFEKSSFECPWNFIYFTPQQVSAIYTHTKPSLLTTAVKEAHEKEVGLIEMWQGDPQGCVEIVATSDVNIEALKKQWCLAYCDAHDYIVVENLCYPHDSAQSQWPSQLLSSSVSSFQEAGDSCEKPLESLRNDIVFGVVIPKADSYTNSPSWALQKCSPVFQERHEARL